MSVIMTLEVEGDPAELERVAAENPDRMRGIADRAIDQRGFCNFRDFAETDDLDQRTQHPAQSAQVRARQPVAHRHLVPVDD